MKKLLTSLMIVAILFSAIIPRHIFAESKEDMRSVTFANWIRTLGSQYPILQSYGLVILKQPNLDIKNMSSIAKNQQIARRNVQEWLDEYSPKIIEVNENMKGLSNRVDKYYNGLYELAGQMDDDPKSKSDLMNRLNHLQNSMEKLQYDMERASTSLNAYEELLTHDTHNFSERAEKAIEALNGKDGEAIKLREQIKSLLKEIQDELVKIVNNPDEVYDFSFNFGQALYNLVKTGMETKTVDIASTEALGKEIMNAKNAYTRESAVNIQQKQKEVTALFKKLSEIERQATEVTIVEDQVVGFTEMVKREISLFDHVNEQMKNLNHVMENLEKDIADGNIGHAELQKQLRYFKTLMDDMNTQTKQFEDFTTAIN